MESTTNYLNVNEGKSLNCKLQDECKFLSI